MCAGDRAHEEDDRQHHETRRDDRGREADLPSPCRIPPPAATRTSKKVPSSSENNRRYSSFGSSNCVAISELEHQQVPGSLRIVNGGGRDFVNRHAV